MFSDERNKSASAQGSGVYPAVFCFFNKLQILRPPASDRYDELDDMMWERTEHEIVKTRLDPPEWAIPAGRDLGCITFDDWEVI